MEFDESGMTMTGAVLYETEFVDQDSGGWVDGVKVAGWSLADVLDMVERMKEDMLIPPTSRVKLE